MPALENGPNGWDEGAGTAEDQPGGGGPDPSQEQVREYPTL